MSASGRRVPANTLHVYEGSAGILTGGIQVSGTVEPGVVLNNTAYNRYDLISGGGGVSAYNNDFFIFDRTNNQARLVINNSGSVGIGTTAPAYLLQVGSVSIGTTTPVAGFQNSADVCALTPASSTPNWSCTSDRRLKTNIADSGSGLAWLEGLRVRDFTMKATGERQTGVIAQELATVHPEMVRMGSNGFLMVDSPNPWVLVKTIQELRDIVMEQQKEIDALKQTTKRGAKTQ